MVMHWWLVAVVTWFKWCSECDGGLWMLNQSNVTVRSHDLRPTAVVQYLTAPLHWGIPSSCVSWTTQAWNNITAARILSGQISKSAQNFVRAKLLNVEKNRGNWFLFWVIHHRLFLFSKNKSSLCLCFHWMIQWSESEMVPPSNPHPLTHCLRIHQPKLWFYRQTAAQILCWVMGCPIAAHWLYLTSAAGLNGSKMIPGWC